MFQTAFFSAFDTIILTTSFFSFYTIILLVCNSFVHTSSSLQGILGSLWINGCSLGAI